jgi:glycosyltransferase involved in cell wall biosynthesis
MRHLRREQSANTGTGTSTNRIVFATTLAGWGGSEELWSRTALDLAAREFAVSANVIEGGAPLHPRLREVQAGGVELWARPLWYSLRTHPWHWLASGLKDPAAYALERLLAARPPALAVLAASGPLPPVELLELCTARRVPFVTIGQANSDDDWCRDDIAERYRIALAAALRCFFVSQANRKLVERHIGAELPNAEIIWNPVNAAADAMSAWPPFGNGGEMRFACVGRLHPPSKGQDILLDALSAPHWSDRPWRLYLYGEGGMRDGIQRLAHSLGISERVVFAGYAAVEQIWAANHVLLMPSRYEGLPLAMVEAMLCARPVVATDVAGHAEIVEDGVTGFLAEAPTARAMAAALERFWLRRGDAEAIGKAGARRIRQIMPPDPVRVFSDKLVKLAELTVPH